METYQKSDLLLFLHPLASFCHKVLIALYEIGIEFDARTVDLLEEESSKELLAYWSVGKIPLLRDNKHNKTIPESSIIIEYLDRLGPHSQKLIVEETSQALETRLWDRFFDHYMSVPMQKIVIDTLRPPGQNDHLGVKQAYEQLNLAYDMVEKQLESEHFIAGNSFSLADCSAAPALFFANTLIQFPDTHPKLGAYFERLMSRPSIKRTLDEAKPYFQMYPFYDRIPKRFLIEKE